MKFNFFHFSHAFTKINVRKCVKDDILRPNSMNEKWTDVEEQVVFKH